MSLLDYTLVVSACMSKEKHFSFDNLGKGFASSLKFIQYALVCPFLRPTSAAFFGSTFQLLLIISHHLSLKSI